MRKIKWVTVLAITFMVCSALTACKTPEQTAYKISGVTVTLVDNSMNAWGDYVRAGLATADDQARVRAAYEKYQAAKNVCKATIVTLKNAPEDQAKWLTVTTVFENTANDLVKLLKTFIPTLKTN